VLLLNLPPDKRGLIHENDAESLRGFRQIIDQTFDTNLLSNAAMSVDPVTGAQDPAYMTDSDPCTFFSPNPGNTSFETEFRLAVPIPFDCLLLQENFRNGQRVENFVLEAFVDGKWKNLCTGTTISYKRIMLFDKVTASLVRLEVLSARGTPEIATVGLSLMKLEINN
jgi:alpha-L-fucosidase